MIFRAWSYTNGIRSNTPTMEVENLAQLVMAVDMSLPLIFDRYPDVTEIAVLDENEVQWYRIRIREDKPVDIVSFLDA